MRVASHFSSYVVFQSASAFVFFKLNVRPWLLEFADPPLHTNHTRRPIRIKWNAGTYASSLYMLTSALLALGMFHVQVHVTTCLDVQALCSLHPLCIFDMANGWSNKRNRPCCCTREQILTRLYGCVGCVPDPVAPSCFAKIWICLFQMISPEEIRVKIRVA